MHTPDPPDNSGAARRLVRQLINSGASSPEPCQYIICEIPTGLYAIRSSGEWLGRFNGYSAAERAVREHATEMNHWPIVWYCVGVRSTETRRLEKAWRTEDAPRHFPADGIIFPYRRSKDL